MLIPGIENTLSLDILLGVFAGSGDIGKFFMLCIPIATEILGQVQAKEVLKFCCL